MIRQLTLLCLGAVACTRDSTGPTLTTVADLAGGWNLSRLELMGVANPSQRLDLKREFGISATLRIAPNGQAVLTVSAQGSEQVDTAAITLHRDTLFYSVSGGSPYVYLLTGSRNSMIWTAVDTDDSFDLDGDGTGDESREVDGWQRL